MSKIFKNFDISKKYVEKMQIYLYMKGEKCKN